MALREYSEGLARHGVALLLDNHNFSKVETICVDVLQDVYMAQVRAIWTSLKKKAELSNRRIPAAVDLEAVMRDRHVSVRHFVDYLKEVKPVKCHLKVPRYPVDRNEHLHMTRPGPNELAHRRTVETHIPAWLPALHPHMDVVIPLPTDSQPGSPTGNETAATEGGEVAAKITRARTTDRKRPIRRQIQLDELPDFAGMTAKDLGLDTIVHIGADAKKPKPPRIVEPIRIEQPRPIMPSVSVPHIDLTTTPTSSSYTPQPSTSEPSLEQSRMGKFTIKMRPPGSPFAAKTKSQLDVRKKMAVNLLRKKAAQPQRSTLASPMKITIKKHLSVAPLKIKRPVVKPIPKPLPTPLPSVPVPSSPMSPPLPSPIVLSDRRVSEGMPVLRRQIKAPVLHDGTVVTSQVGGVNKKLSVEEATPTASTSTPSTVVSTPTLKTKIGIKLGGKRKLVGDELEKSLLKMKRKKERMEKRKAMESISLPTVNVGAEIPHDFASASDTNVVKEPEAKRPRLVMKFGGKPTPSVEPAIEPKVENLPPVVTAPIVKPEVEQMKPLKITIKPITIKTNSKSRSNTPAPATPGRFSEEIDDVSLHALSVDVSTPSTSHLPGQPMSSSATPQQTISPIDDSMRTITPVRDKSPTPAPVVVAAVAKEEDVKIEPIAVATPTPAVVPKLKLTFNKKIFATVTPTASPVPSTSSAPTPKAPPVEKVAPKKFTLKLGNPSKPKKAKKEKLSGWDCPICALPYEEGGPDMIGCDNCDAWYHWSCVGIIEPPPGDQKWYCMACGRRKSIANAGRRDSSNSLTGKKRGSYKKKKKTE